MLKAAVYGLGKQKQNFESVFCYLYLQTVKIKVKGAHSHTHSLNKVPVDLFLKGEKVNGQLSTSN